MTVEARKVEYDDKIESDPYQSGVERTQGWIDLGAGPEGSGEREQRQREKAKPKSRRGEECWRG